MNKLIQTIDVVKYLVPKYAKGYALDVGAGTAKYRNIIKPYVSKYVTCDIKGGAHIDYVEDVTKLSFEENSFDTVFSFQVLEHVASPERMLAEIYRCLKPDGVCILTVPFLHPQHKDPDDYRRYTKSGLAKTFEDHNFTVLEYNSYGNLFTVLGEFVKLLYVDPYSDKKPGRVCKKLANTAMRFLLYLDSLNLSKNSNFYACVYIVAKK